MKRAIYIPFDHLHRKHGALKGADPKSDLIVFVESARMTTGRNWHKERLFFLISSARHFAQTLEVEGFKVAYLKAATTIDGLKEIAKKHGALPIVCAEPSSFRQYEALKSHKVTFVENDFFLTSRSLFKLWADEQKSYLMENFYRKQRLRLNVLMVGTDPIGGSWNFDKDNRMPPPKKYEGAAYLEHKRDEIDKEVAAELSHVPTNTWATTRKGALAQLKNFIDNHFAEFGPLEDAMTTQNWALHHSLLSPYLNNGLLHPSEVIDAAMKAFETGNIPIESAEGFVRQVIGWREYVNGMYWFLGPEYRSNNQLGANRKLLPLFSDPSAKLRLEAIVHPLVGLATQAQAQSAIQAGHTLLVFDVPLLVESPRWRKLVDKVLVVDCLESTQVARVMARSGMTSDAVQSIIRAQATRAQRLAAADITLFNEGLDLKQLRLAVDALTLNV